MDLMLPETEMVSLFLPEKPEEAVLTAELWELEGCLEDAEKRSGGDMRKWVEATQAIFKERYDLSLTKIQTDTIIRTIRSAWNVYAKKNEVTVNLPSGMASPPEQSATSGGPSS